MSVLIVSIFTKGFYIEVSRWRRRDPRNCLLIYSTSASLLSTHKQSPAIQMAIIYMDSHWLSCTSCYSGYTDNRPSWRIWTDLRDLVSTFDTDDVMQRFIILFTLTCLLGFTINMTEGLEGTLPMIVCRI
jgi:hypothetical protein